jgi:CubicO group peptidase (beta-lactamase class C family)
MVGAKAKRSAGRAPARVPRNPERKLKRTLSEARKRLAVPGAAVGVYHRGVEHFAVHGVTSIDNPLPVDEHTLFQIGSVGKTFTATALMRLVEDGRIDLDSPVRHYVPELRLRDEVAAESVTILQLLNHTAGWEGDFFTDTGAGDDALARYVEAMAGLEQVSTPGSAVSYNNASFSLAGRVIEKVTNATFEHALRELVLIPLGLTSSFFFPTEIMTRRFVVGHRQGRDGSIIVTRPWALPRSTAPAGGLSASIRDQLAWARFHLGDGTTVSGARVLSEASLRRMQQPTASAEGTALGNHIGIAWLLREAGGLCLVGHDGATNGQHTSLLMVPEREWAIALVANSGPNGVTLMREIQRWALGVYLRVEETEPEPAEVDAIQLEQYVGEYRSIGYVCEVIREGERLSFAARYSAEVTKQLTETPEEAPEAPPPFMVGFLPHGADRYVIIDGPSKGRTGCFGRGHDGRVTCLHLYGRLLRRK